MSIGYYEWYYEYITSQINNIEPKDLLAKLKQLYNESEKFDEFRSTIPGFVENPFYR